MKNTHIEVLTKVSKFFNNFLQNAQIPSCDMIVIFKGLTGSFKRHRTALHNLFQFRQELLSMLTNLNINIIQIFDNGIVAYNGCKGSKRRQNAARINKILLSKYVYASKN
jgi:hypothetical protein